MSTKCTVLGRAWVNDDGTSEIETWVHEFEPMKDGSRAGAEWAKDHLGDEDLRELFGLPADGNFQVIFKGTMEGEHTHGFDGDEWDQWFDLEECEKQAVPDEYFQTRFGVCEHGIGEGNYCEACNKAYKKANVENELGE